MSRENKEPIDQLEQLIGYQFRDRENCRNALTHGSRNTKKPDYQRLEFLGDRVLSLVIADDLFHRFSTEQEGQLAARLSLLVRGESCAAIGMALGLEDYIIVGVTEKKKGVQRNSSVVGDVVEALIGALYLDGGLEVARHFIIKNWNAMLASAPLNLKDAKTFVQEWALARALALPQYDVTSREGLEHAPIFTITLKVGPYEQATGTGPSKQSAEMAAASEFISREGLR